jgi:formamidopyrimidine-DNA glycosylase
MPELPEVETVVRLVRPRVEGRLIKDVEVSWVRSLGGLSERSFREQITGSLVKRVWRRAKWIVFDLERLGAPEGHLLCHLRMTGRLHVEPTEADMGPYERVRLDLDNEESLFFIDVRKFGRFTYENDAEERFAGLGPEPLTDEFSAAWFRAALGSRKRQLKPLLLDQSFLAGLGNIYVDEALHAARLHPTRRSDRVPAAAADRLHAEIRDVLAAAIRREGSSFDTFYRTPEGQPGSYQEQFLVYGRDGKPCRFCGRTIKKMVVAQRGTHICTRCQPVPRG